MLPPSTAAPERLPDIESLRRLTKSIAMLDAIICPQWEYRYYSYNCHWDEDEEMASMRNGCADDWFLLFNADGAALKGFAHEFPLARDSSFAARIQEIVPPIFESFLRDSAFSMDVASFCIWRRRTDAGWNVVTPAKRGLSPEMDGSAELLSILDGQPETYRDWAVGYYEREIPLRGVRAIYEHAPLSEDLVAILNPDILIPNILKDTSDIGYPLAPQA